MKRLSSIALASCFVFGCAVVDKEPHKPVYRYDKPSPAAVAWCNKHGGWGCGSDLIGPMPLGPAEGELGGGAARRPPPGLETAAPARHR